jgi:hypothetical protein
MPLELTFTKTGAEIKEAIGNRLKQLQARLTARNADLNQLMDDRTKLRSYLVRSSETNWGSHGVPQGAPMLHAASDISSEERDEIKQLCARISEIEQEMRRLTLIRSHLQDTASFPLPYRDLVSYGFDAGFEVGDQ